MKTKDTDPASDCELRASHLLNAPRELVWEVWTNPDLISLFWGLKNKNPPTKPGGFRC